MPLHMTALVSRHQLDNPNEPSPVKDVPPAYERVLKYNPNHGPDGKFSSSGGGKAGGTMGAPTTGAFGQKLPRYRSVDSAQSRMDGGFLRGGPPTTDPNFHKGPATSHFDAHFNRGEKPIEGHTLRYPAEHSKGGQFKLPTNYPGSMRASGKPKKRSSFS
jgi:hypothetical protein